MARNLRTWVICVCLTWVAVAGGQASKPAAIVNGDQIPMSEVDAAIALRPQPLTPLTQAAQRRLKFDVVNALIDERLMRQFLSKNAPPIAKAEVDAQMTALAESLKAEGKTLAKYCQESGQTEAQLRLNIENLLRFNAHVKAKATEAVLKPYFEANKDFFQNVKVRASHIVIRVSPAAPDAERDSAKKKLATLRADILAAKVTFADAARAHSHCDSAAKGGDLGFFTRKWMVEEPFAKVAFSLKPNDLSQVVDTDFGVHLILVTDRSAAKPIEFSHCLEDVRDCYIEEMRQNIAEDLRKAARVEILIKD